MLEGPVTLTSAVSTMKKVNKENGKVFIEKNRPGHQSEQLIQWKNQVNMLHLLLWKEFAPA